MAGLSIAVLGNGGGIPCTPPRGNTNFAVFHEALEGITPREALCSRPFWLIDCGPETVTLLAELDAFKNLQGVIITHCHADHSGGLSSLAWRMMFMEQRKIHLVYEEGLQGFIQAQTVELQYANEQRNLDNGRDPAAWATLNDYFDVTCPRANVDFVDLFDEGDVPIRVQLFRVDHNIRYFPAFGLTIQRSRKTVVVSGDTAYPLPRKQVEEADLTFHDCQFYNPGDGREVHAPYPKLLGEYPPELRQRVVLCHTEVPRDINDGFQVANLSLMYPVR